MEALCHQYLAILPTVFADEREGTHSFTLHHHDLSMFNILVDPKSYEITGIIDWEMINTAPSWLACDHPRFLQYLEAEDEEELAQLRDHYDEVMKRLGGMLKEDSITDKAKHDCYEVIPHLTDMWTWSRKWLYAYKMTGVSKNHDDWANDVDEGNDSDEENAGLGLESEKLEVVILRTEDRSFECEATTLR